MFRPPILAIFKEVFFGRYVTKNKFFIFFQYTRILVLCNLGDKASIKLLGIFIIVFVLVSLIRVILHVSKLNGIKLN